MSYVRSNSKINTTLVLIGMSAFTSSVLAQELIQVLQVSIPGSEPLFGSAISKAGDVDGDGYSDVLVGAYLDSTADTWAGSAWVLSGKDGSVIFVTYGTKHASNLGWSVAGLGDVDADGFPDISVGDRAYSATIPGQGMVRLTLIPIPLGAGGSGLFFANIPTFLKGHSITMQAIVPDSGGSGKFAASRGMKLNILNIP